jgi:hypothetical protein
MNIDWDEVDNILDRKRIDGPVLRDTLAEAGYQIVRRQITEMDVPHLRHLLDDCEDMSGAEIIERLSAAGYAIVSKAELKGDLG